MANDPSIVAKYTESIDTLSRVSFQVYPITLGGHESPAQDRRTDPAASIVTDGLSDILGSLPNTAYGDATTPRGSQDSC